ncbi:MAG TPA: glycosyltransferase family 2 protein [Rubrobacteraceae bacterium]|nr:glycosyltransferase family 2 protein [Rubrobacteraceae bacterium]
MRFSIVIVNYASWPLTVRCIEALHETGYPSFEVVVVDNDRTEPPEIPQPVRVIRNKENVGVARAWNQGITASTGEIVVLLNPDTTVGHDFFERVEVFFAENLRAGVAGPRILDDDGTLQLSARTEVSMISGLFGRTSLLTRLFPKSALVKSQFPAVAEASAPTKVDWVSGACMAVRRHVLEEVGPLDERFFMYFEDADLCRRAREAGWSVYYLPHVEVTHRAGGSTRSRPRAIWRLHRSAFLYHRKHGDHGPLDLYSILVLLGLSARALAKLAASLAGRA